MPAPFNWTEDVVVQICERLAGGEGIREIGGTNGLPSEPTIYRRMASDRSFAALIAAAREAQQDYEVDYCVELADSATPENWQVVKLQIWARQWRASKLAPKKYGERLNVEGTVVVDTAAEILAARNRGGL